MSVVWLCVNVFAQFHLTSMGTTDNARRNNVRETHTSVENVGKTKSKGIYNKLTKVQASEKIDIFLKKHFNQIKKEMSSHSRTFCGWFVWGWREFTWEAAIILSFCSSTNARWDNQIKVFENNSSKKLTWNLFFFVVPRKYLPPVIHHYRMGSTLVVIQVLLGSVLLALGFHLLHWSPQLNIRDIPHWSGIPVLYNQISIFLNSFLFFQVCISRHLEFLTDVFIFFFYVLFSSTLWKIYDRWCYPASLAYFSCVAAGSNIQGCVVAVAFSSSESNTL